MGAFFSVLPKILLVSSCVMVWILSVLFVVFSIFNFTSSVNRNTKKPPLLNLWFDSERVKFISDLNRCKHFVMPIYLQDYFHVMNFT